MTFGEFARRVGRFRFPISLAVNVFLVAVIIAYLVTHRPEGPRWGASPRLDRIASTLPAPDGDKLRSTFAARSGEVGAATAAYRQARIAIRQALRAEPFDQSRLREAMAEARAKRVALETMLQDVVTTAAAEMSGEGRARLADWPRTR
ncbi:MAG: periplasmic heavy metal sensor [Proteobacteria bacterium]|nr:periplasmic heavy metal sensor [Pseudomonadota bacterium]